MSDEYTEEPNDDDEPADNSPFGPYGLFGYPFSRAPETKKQQRERLAREAKIAEHTKPHETERVKRAGEYVQRTERYEKLKSNVCKTAIEAAGRIMARKDVTPKQVADFATDVLHHLAQNLAQSETKVTEVKRKAERIKTQTAKRIQKRAGVA
jgi:phosphoribosyl-ATP pyrophosphohydrolase